MVFLIPAMLCYAKFQNATLNTDMRTYAVGLLKQPPTFHHLLLSSQISQTTTTCGIPLTEPKAAAAGFTLPYQFFGTLQ